MFCSSGFKKYFCLFLTFQLSICAFGQDRIITNQGDTINCKIKSVSDLRIKFLATGSEVFRSIPLSMVSDHLRSAKKKEKRKKQRLQVKTKGLSFRMTHGVAHVFKDYYTVPKAFQRYINVLKTGYNFTTELTYFFGKHVGLGPRYSLFTASEKLSNQYFVDETGNLTIGDLSDKIILQDVGLNIIGRVAPKTNNFRFLLGLTVGYTHFKDNATRPQAFKVTAENIGFGMNSTIDAMLTPRLFGGLGINVMYSNFTRYKIKQGNMEADISLHKDDYINVLRIEVNLGLRYDF